MEQTHKPQYVLKIDAHAYSVALTIARLAGEQECMFLLLGEAGPNVVRHVLLLPAQQVTSCSCNITARSMSAAIDEIEQLNDTREPKWVVLGWGHSHGFLDPFHSAIDVDTSDDVIAQIGFANRWVIEEPLNVSVTEDGDLSVSLGEEDDDVVLRTGAPALAERLAKGELHAIRRIAAGFAYSLVVNAHGDAYAEVITQSLGATNGQARTQRHLAVVQVIPEPLDEAALRQEIDRKIDRKLEHELQTVILKPSVPCTQPVRVRSILSLIRWWWGALRKVDRRLSVTGGECRD